MTSSSGLLLISPRRRVLLCRRSDTLEWATPAGHVERGEKPADAAVRELVEETGFDRMLFDLHQLHRTRAFTLFVATVTHEFKPVLNHEHTECGWFDLRSLPEPLHPGLRGVIA
jgi:8-oxo-dGTP pyrophosphatase MutT (NUDIX family)